MKIKTCATVVLVLLASLLTAMPAAAAAEPSVTVAPATGLEGGTTVRVSGSGLPAGVPIDVVQCDLIHDSDGGGLLTNCPALASRTSSASGTVSLSVQVVTRTSRQEASTTIPVDCRGDGCHIFLVWQDALDSDYLHHAASPALDFVGSPPSVSVDPSQNLANYQVVTVSGRLEGAEGRTIRVLEQTCFTIVQASSCFGALPATSGTVRSDSTFSVRYPAQRFLSDGSDCTQPDDFLRDQCRISVVVLDGSGNPDNSFGPSDQGDPGADISFGGASLSASKTTGLSGGTRITVQAKRVTPGALQLVQCDSYATGREVSTDGHCGALTTVRSTSSGTVSAAVALADPVYHAYADGSKVPVYCRDDACRLFLVSVDGEGNTRVEAQTDRLTFTGSSATLDAKPAANLAAVKWTTLWGRAAGAEGHSIKVVEQACYPADQDKACYGQLPVKWGKVKSDGTFVVKYPAHRYLADQAKTDCTAVKTGAACRISIVVLDARGVRDDSFGVSKLGQPGVEITFKR